MMVLGFCAGNQSFGISIDHVFEVVPLLDIESLDSGIAGFLGTFDFRGARIPLFDLRLVQEGVGANRALSTRIIILEYADHRVGLLAEQVLELFELDDGDALSERTIVTPEAIIPESLYSVFSA